MKRLHTAQGYIFADQVVDGVPVNPRLPAAFDDTANDYRPDSHRKFWNVPFIVTETVENLDAFYAGRTDDYAEGGRRIWTEGRETWLKAWPSGTRYEVRCLDGGAWDRATSWGMFPSLDAALDVARSGPSWR